MITNERLKELLDKEATVWYISDKYVNSLWLLKDNNYVFESLEKMDLYENKEDAEFVAKYHTKRPEYFEPPTYEEFLKLNNQSTCWDFMNKDNQRNFILVSNDVYTHNDMMKPKEEWTVVVQDEYDDYIFEEPLTKENYYKAVEKARKLFLGEKDED